MILILCNVTGKNAHNPKSITLKKRISLTDFFSMHSTKHQGHYYLSYHVWFTEIVHDLTHFPNTILGVDPTVHNALIFLKFLDPEEFCACSIKFPSPPMKKLKRAASFVMNCWNVELLECVILTFSLESMQANKPLAWSQVMDMRNAVRNYRHVTLQIIISTRVGRPKAR